MEYRRNEIHHVPYYVSGLRLGNIICLCPAGNRSRDIPERRISLHTAIDIIYLYTDVETYRQSF